MTISRRGEPSLRRSWFSTDSPTVSSAYLGRGDSVRGVRRKERGEERERRERREPARAGKKESKTQKTLAKDSRRSQ
jgi:hypothetical protein